MAPGWSGAESSRGGFFLEVAPTKPLAGHGRPVGNRDRLNKKGYRLRVINNLQPNIMLALKRENYNY